MHNRNQKAVTWSVSPREMVCWFQPLFHSIFTQFPLLSQFLSHVLFSKNPHTAFLGILSSLFQYPTYLIQSNLWVWQNLNPAFLLQALFYTLRASCLSKESHDSHLNRRKGNGSDHASKAICSAST